jgi:hypothetical protein
MVYLGTCITYLIDFDINLLQIYTYTTKWWLCWVSLWVRTTWLKLHVILVLPLDGSANNFFYYYYYLVCEVIDTAATPGLLCQPRVIVKMIVEKQMECRLAGETEVLGEILPQRHFCPSQNPTWPDPGLNSGRRGGKPATNRLSYGAAFPANSCFSVVSIHFHKKILLKLISCQIYFVFLNEYCAYARCSHLVYLNNFKQ